MKRDVKALLMAHGLQSHFFTKKRTRSRQKEYNEAFFMLDNHKDRLVAAQKWGLPQSLPKRHTRSSR
jgi:hypothetical protein